tara:strand:+ start:1002 stop:2024 length:1023 start_codon:yes stop_codon:yes gene_type:complete
MSKKNSNVRSLKNAVKDNKKIQEIYLNFKTNLRKTIKNKRFIVAISGGPDSLALAALSKLYQLDFKTKVLFVLIDHGIRKNSNKEANQVKKILNKKKIILNVIRNDKKIIKNIQNEARNIRYDLLLKYSKKNKANFILTGHHSDDQIETFFIRLSRGSGIQGLSSMKKITKLTKSIKLIRPLLDYKKKDLVFIARKSFGSYIKDPSNTDKKFLRVKIRSLKKNLEKSGIYHDQIIKSINNLASTRDLLNEYLEKASLKYVKRKKKETLINIKKLNFESKEVKLKVLSHEIKDFSKSYYPPRSKKVLYALKKVESLDRVKLTLGGCFLEKRGDFLSIKKEI